MLHYTNEQLASVLAVPIVTILLVWTTAIFHKNRKNWGGYDIAIVTIMILSILRNLTVLTYTLFVILNQDIIGMDYCSCLVWIFNSIHTFQASALTTLAIIGLFAVKLHRKQHSLRHFLTSTHVIYHLFCLTTLCACVGVAAILAQTQNVVYPMDPNPCKFMPFDLDIKYNVFIIVLHVFLSTVSLIAFIATCVHYFHMAHQDGFDYLKKSNSDLSELSNDNNNFDTFPHKKSAIVWNNSDVTTTVSSTNSRRPCLQHPPIKNETVAEDDNRTGLETTHPVLIVCYLFYHLPLIVLCIYPNLVAPWPIAAIALWLGLIQDILIPIGLSIVDSRFCKWVSNVYRSEKHGGDKPPQVGLDGKFRPFSSAPQSLQQHQSQLGRTIEHHRFPITNGSLYTSIDGRLPVIHNYRRRAEPIRKQLSHDFGCRSCQMNLCPSHSDLHHLSPQYLNKQLNSVTAAITSEEMLMDNEEILRNSRNLVRLNKMRLCKSEDSLNNNNNNNNNVRPTRNHQYEYASSSDDDYVIEPPPNQNCRFDTLSSQSSCSITTEANCDFDFFQSTAQPTVPNHTNKIHRSNSYMTLEDRNRCKRNEKKLLRSDSKLSDCTHNFRQKIKSVEYLPNNNASTVFIEDVFYFNYPKRGGSDKYIGSVPDLKKVFISEYI